MYLNVKTRGDSREKGKTKLYISCYNSNQNLVVERISEWIFKVRNYAIYYPEVIGSYDAIDHNEDLMAMACIIIPVFPDTMETDTYSFWDYQFAVNNHIPVITILMEETVSPVFYARYQRIYGDMQLLTPYSSNDATKVPFNQVLIQYLEKLTSDDVESYQKYQEEGYFPEEINQKILNAFRGRIFISYRKKNRRLVKDLIHRLHEESELSDIMLWYDEYLVPGENFTEALRESIIKSDLILLLVTKDILEVGNYVLTDEYPLACESNKTIVAVEYEEIDEDTLKEKFPDLDLCIRPEELEQLPGVLSQLFRMMKGSQKLIEGERAFVLGKAYMDGKLVETDRKRGVNLIRKAAEENFIPAIRTIIGIYEQGNGVKADPKQRLMWENKLESLLEGKVKEGKNKTAGTGNLDVLMNLYEKQGCISMESGDFYEALESYKKMRQCAVEISQANEDCSLGAAFATYEILACNKIANACMYLNDYKQARIYLEMALEKYNKSHREDISLGGNVPIAETWKELGELESAESRKQKALECYRQALQYIENGPDVYQLSKANEISRCEIYELMGGLHSESGKNQEALMDFQQSLKLAERINAEWPDKDSILCVIRANYEIGNLFKKNSQQEDAIRFYMAALTYAEKIAEKTADKEYSSECYHQVFDYSIGLADCLYSLHRNSEASEYLHKAEKLLDEKGTKIAAPEEVLQLYNLSGNIAYSQKKPAAARKYYKKLLDHSKIVYKKKRNVRSAADLGTAYYKLSTANPYITDWISLDQACEIYQSLSRVVPDNEQFASAFRKIYKTRSDKYAVLEQNHSKIRRWSEHTFHVAQAIDQSGLRLPDHTRLQSRIEADILEMVMMLIADNSEKIDEAAEMLTFSMGETVTTDELSRYIFMRSLFKDDKSSLSTFGIPQSIQFTVQLMKTMRHQTEDYHDGYPFEIRIVMWSIGEWILDIINADSKMREDFINYFDEIDYFIESN